MQIHFHVSQRDQLLGPFTVDEIVTKFNSGYFEPVDYVYVEAKADWIPMFEFLRETNEAAPTLTDSPPVVDELPPVQKEIQPTTPEVIAKNIVLSGGQATVSLSSVRAETVAIELEAAEARDLESDGSTSIIFEAGPPEKLELDVPERGQCGSPLAIRIFAVDSFGNPSRNYAGEVAVETTPASNGHGAIVELKDGEGSVSLDITKAGTYDVSVSQPAGEGLDLPAPKPVVMEAAGAVRLVIEPHQANAQVGKDALVTIKAVDPYGNVDTRFSGSALLRLMAKQGIQLSVKEVSQEEAS